MIVPLIVLAVASLLGGFLGLPGKLGVIQRFLEPVFAPANAHPGDRGARPRRPSTTC